MVGSMGTLKTPTTSISTIHPTVMIQNGPCITCKFWIDKNCRIDKQPDEALDCPYYAHGT